MEKNKFNYSIYDYSKIGIKKDRVVFRRTISRFELDFYKKNNCFNTINIDEIVKQVVNTMKKDYSKKLPRIYHVSPNFNFEWQIITPEKNYVFNETSYKEE